MMPTQLTSWLLFQNAAVHHREVEIVSKEGGVVHRYTYGDFARRAQQLMHALDRLGIASGERVATLAWPAGYFVIGDRSKDLIKSGGEWISSVDMERTIMAMAEVEEAAVIAIPDPKWQERPLACIVVRTGHTLELAKVREHLEDNGFASWQLPDRIELIEVVPKTSVGTFDKKVLRARFATML